MFIPTKEYFCNMTPQEFEKYSLEILKEQTKGLENLKMQHNVIIKKNDGNYQIDGKIEFEVMGIKYVTLVECKHYKNPITREKVQVLYDKIRAIGANKGILISTSNFQIGAINYAKEHGIALIQLVESGLTYEMRNRENIIMMNECRSLCRSKKTYIGIMQIGHGHKICCEYLKRDNNFLKEFLIRGKEKSHV